MDDKRSAPRLGDSLAWLHLLVAVVTAMVVVARTLEIAGCDDQCNYPTLEFVTRGFWTIDLVVFITTIGSYFFAQSRWKNAWVIPAVGITITLIAFVLTNIAMNGALAVS